VVATERVEFRKRIEAEGVDTKRSRRVNDKNSDCDVLSADTAGQEKKEIKE
jgi:hypothetical protein